MNKRNKRNKRIKKIALISLIALTALQFANITIKVSNSEFAPTPTPTIQLPAPQDVRIEVSDKVKNYINSTVVVLQQTSDGANVGTAVALHSNLFITNEHVVASSGECTIIKNPGRPESFDCEVVYTNKKLDLALVQVKDPLYVHPASVTVCEFMQINFTKDYYNYAFDSMLSSGEEALIMSMRTTQLTASHKYQMLFFNEIGIPGRSGSGVFDEQNNCVLSIAKTGYSVNSMGGGISNVVVVKFLNDYNQTLIGA